MEKLKRVSLDFPHSWDELSGKQLEDIHRMKEQAQVIAQKTGDEERAVHEYKLRVFLYLSGLKVRKRAYKMDDGTFIYIVRRKGWKHLFEEIPMENWQVAQWIKDLLGFLDEPEGLLNAPYDFIKVGGKRYKAPDPQLTSVTFEQYNHAQQCLIAYWDLMKSAEEMLKDGGTRKGVKHLFKEAEEYKARFLATLFTPPVKQTSQSDENGTYEVHRIAYIYHSSQSDCNWKKFTGDRWKYTFEVMLQFVQSCLAEYKNKFPELFTSHGSGGSDDFIVLEADKMNAIKKYGNFKGYQDIYDSNAFFIFGMLKDMCKEAKAIEEMNKKIKNKK